MNAVTLKIQLDHMAVEKHLSESDLVNEALVLYLAQRRGFTARIQEGLSQAQHGVIP